MAGISNGRRGRKRVYLTRAKELLVKPENWCQHGYAQLPDGRFLERYDLDGAVRFSLEAAVHKATGSARVVHPSDLIVDLVETICNGGLPRDHLDWKVAPDVLQVFSKLGTYDDVVRLLKDTIARV